MQAVGLSQAAGRRCCSRTLAKRRGAGLLPRLRLRMPRQQHTHIMPYALRLEFTDLSLTSTLAFRQHRLRRI